MQLASRDNATSFLGGDKVRSAAALVLLVIIVCLFPVPAVIQTEANKLNGSSKSAETRGRHALKEHVAEESGKADIRGHQPDAKIYAPGSTVDHIPGIVHNRAAISSMSKTAGLTVDTTGFFVAAIPHRDTRVKNSLQNSQLGDRGYFTIGSSQREVFAVQGKPTEISGNTWSYGYSKVEFNDGLLIGFENSSLSGHNLRVLVMQRTASRAARAGCFKIGASQQDVVDVMGTPTEIDGNIWRYGYSKIVFSNDSVASYENSPLSNYNLRVRMTTTHSSKSATKAFFTLGSTKQDVLDAMGTPTEISGDTWYYRYSKVRFLGGAVDSYENSSLSNHNLRVQLLCNQQSAAGIRGYFFISSSEQDVLDVMGTPTEISGDTWYYGYSKIRFSRGAVASYENSPLSNYNLRIQLMCNRHSAAARRGYFSISSSEQDVLDIMGTPTEMSGDTWYYGYSKVRFSRGAVMDFENSSLSNSNLRVR